MPVNEVSFSTSVFASNQKSAVEQFNLDHLFKSTSKAAKTHETESKSQKKLKKTTSALNVTGSLIGDKSTQNGTIAQLYPSSSNKQDISISEISGCGGIFVADALSVNDMAETPKLQIHNKK